MLRLGAGCLIVAIFAVGGCGGSSNTSGESTAGRISPAKALEIGKRSGAVPSRIGASVQCSGGGEADEVPVCPNAPPAPELVPEGDSYVMRGTSARIARDPSRGMQFHLTLGHQIITIASATPVDLSGSASGAIPIADDRGLFFANAYPATDIVMTPGVSGVEETLQIRGPSAPTEFSWRVVGSGTQLVAQPKNDVAGLHYRTRTPSGSFSGWLLLAQVDPFPHDSAGYPYKPGTELETQLTASGDRITVRVDHSSHDLVYPLLVAVGWENTSLVGRRISPSG